MAGNRLFSPGESLQIRDPLANSRENGNIINPPRLSQLGGLDALMKTNAYRNNAGIYKNTLGIQKPGSTLRPVPMSSGYKQR
jgi:hypothetical protein